MILINNVSKKFDDKTVFDDYYLGIEEGTFTIISGPSGCGKTTLLYMLGGIEKPDKGEILYGDTDINKTSKRLFYRDTVGFLFQNFALVENKTVKENLSMIQKSGRSETSIEEALKTVGLSDKLNTKVYKLSGGEQQRVALARLLVKKNSVILADEPTGSLDSENAKMVMQILHKLNKEGKTIIMVTHDASLFKGADVIVEIRDGI